MLQYKAGYKFVEGGVHVQILDFPAIISCGADLDDGKSAAAYRVGEIVPVGDDMVSLVGLWRRPLQVGQPLPTLPPLNVHRAVTIDLEETYHRATKRAYLD